MFEQEETVFHLSLNLQLRQNKRFHLWICVPFSECRSTQFLWPSHPSAPWRCLRWFGFIQTPSHRWARGLGNGSFWSRCVAQFSLVAHLIRKTIRGELLCLRGTIPRSANQSRHPSCSDQTCTSSFPYDRRWSLSWHPRACRMKRQKIRSWRWGARRHHPFSIREVAHSWRLVHLLQDRQSPAQFMRVS